MCRQSQQAQCCTRRHSNTQSHIHTNALSHMLTYARHFKHTTLKRNNWKRRRRKKMKQKQKQKRKKPVCLSYVVSMWLWFRPFTVWNWRRVLSHSCSIRDTIKSCSMSFVYTAYELKLNTCIEIKMLHEENSIYTVNQIDLNAWTQHTYLTSRFSKHKMLTQHVCIALTFCAPSVLLFWINILFRYAWNSSEHIHMQTLVHIWNGNSHVIEYNAIFIITFLSLFFPNKMISLLVCSLPYAYGVWVEKIYT